MFVRNLYFSRGKVPMCSKSVLKWLGWQDSNLRMPGSKPGALPLGDTPSNWKQNRSPVNSVKLTRIL